MEKGSSQDLDSLGWIYGSPDVLGVNNGAEFRSIIASLTMNSFSAGSNSDFRYSSLRKMFRCK